MHTTSQDHVLVLYADEVDNCHSLQSSSSSYTSCLSWFPSLWACLVNLILSHKEVWELMVTSSQQRSANLWTWLHIMWRLAYVQFCHVFQAENESYQVKVWFMFGSEYFSLFDIRLKLCLSRSLGISWRHVMNIPRATGRKNCVNPFHQIRDWSPVSDTTMLAIKCSCHICQLQYTRNYCAAGFVLDQPDVAVLICIYTICLL